ncbi:acyltransferase family protein [Bifidobacterium leontopitheci]|uniref:Acyltransferase 3 n=1 Tax=Bifidobacterium leontopitheci TaxID=2650774 RepID=A0A6I1GLS3_9BIFI|nr:acyltransferase [Bifidobacterium leontopitheci]KAB7790349.1 acyltransferase 3 [Bifidobacterium leontopitheci]
MSHEQALSAPPVATIEQVGVRKRRYRYDVLRVIAAICIIVFHFEAEFVSRGIGGSSPSHTGFALNMFGLHLSMGSLSICVFFMLSGMLSAKDIDNPSFKTWPYYRKRFLRLFIPFYIAYFVVYTVNILRGSVAFQVPAPYFLLTVFGLDGYLSSSFAPLSIPSFYLIGEWFFGALVVVTVLWPLIRWMLAKWSYVSLVVLFVLEILIPVIASHVGMIPDVLRYPTGCIATFTLGAVISKYRIKHATDRTALRKMWTLGLVMTVVAMCSTMVPGQYMGALRNQMLAAGIIIIVDFTGFRNKPSHQENNTGTHRLIVLLSDLSMYAFLFQHVIIVDVLNSVSGIADSNHGFSTIDYYCLMCFIIILVFAIAFVVSEFENAIRQKLRNR